MVILGGDDWQQKRMFPWWFLTLFALHQKCSCGRHKGSWENKSRKFLNGQGSIRWARWEAIPVQDTEQAGDRREEGAIRQTIFPTYEEVARIKTSGFFPKGLRRKCEFRQDDREGGG